MYVLQTWIAQLLNLQWAFALLSSCTHPQIPLVHGVMLKLSLAEVFTAQTVCFSHAACNDQLQPPDVTARCHHRDVVMARCVAGH